MSRTRSRPQRAYDPQVEEFVTRLQRRQIRGSSTCGIKTAEVLRTVISKGTFRSAQELIDLVRRMGKRITQGNPIELTIGNVVRRILYIIREEVAQFQHDQEAGADAKGQTADSSAVLPAHPPASVRAASMLTLLEEAPDSKADLSSHKMMTDLKAPITEEIGELISEIKTVYANIGDQAVEHIHAREVIMTFGTSKTVLTFFKEAAQLRQFHVIVAESAPSFSGHQMAAQLAELGIETTVITDSAVFAMMSTVNKVIIGVHGVMANGGIIAHTGAHNIAVAAKAHSVPFVVVCGMYKLCPLFAFDQDTFNEQNAPDQVLKFEDALNENVAVENPAFDYISPDLVSLFITNFGGHNPSYVYRLLQEYYHEEDYDL